MGNVIDIFAHANLSSGQTPSPDAISIDVTPIAWMPMHEIRQKVMDAGPTGRHALLQVFLVVARALVASRYAEPDKAGVYRAASNDTALRRAADLLDLANELAAETQPAIGGNT